MSDPFDIVAVALGRSSDGPIPSCLLGLDGCRQLRKLALQVPDTARKPADLDPRPGDLDPAAPAPEGTVVLAERSRRGGETRLGLADHLWELPRPTGERCEGPIMLGEAKTQRVGGRLVRGGLLHGRLRPRGGWRSRPWRSGGACRSLHRRAHEPKPAKKSEPGLSNRTVRYIHTIIHAALRDALRWNRLARNVADAATPPPQGSTKRGRPNVWTADQLGLFLDFVADSPYLPAWLYLATSGSRRGEVLGLKWDDLDLDVATAIMSRQVTMVDHRVVVKELPKTKAGHTILLDPGTIEMLANHRDRQAEIKRLLGAAYHDDGWVFCRPDGMTLHPERFSRHFLRKQETYNKAHPDEPLPRLKLHGLRHTWATLALQEGIDIHVVSDRLAHSSTHITSEIYTHVTRPMQSDAAERVAARIFDRRRADAEPR